MVRFRHVLSVFGFKIYPLQIVIDI